MNELTSEAARTASILKQIGGKVESLTRFVLSDISVTDVETVDVPVACELRYIVLFCRSDNAGYGALPHGTVSMPNKAALDSYIQNLRINAEQGLSGRLTRWADEHSVPPEPPLVANNCFDNKPAAGYVYTCPSCGGSKRVTCSGCRGSGDVTCTSCSGSGNISCSGCGGRGSTQKIRWKDRQVYNPADNRTYTETYQESYYESCFSCGGSGRVKCSCSGGKVRCSTCGGSGEVNCGNCHATGTLFASARLTCEVRSSFVISTTTSFSEAQEKIQALPSVTALALLATVARTYAKVVGNMLVNTYAATIQVTRLKIIAAKLQFEILGYGNSASVENFKNIIGVMLENDLAELEKSLQRTAWISLRPNPDLDAALVNVLKSGMHSRIVTEGSQPAKGSQSLAQQEFAYLVSDEYATRAFQTIKDSLARLFRGHGLAGVALALGTTTVLCIVAHILRLNELGKV